MRWLTLCLLVLLTGCGGGLIEEALDNLDAAPAQRRRAEMELLLISEDPLPAMMKKLQDDDTSLRAKRSILTIMGRMYERQEREEIIDQLVGYLDHPDRTLRRAALEAMGASIPQTAVSQLVLMREEALREKMPAEYREAVLDAIETVSRVRVREIRELWSNTEAALAAYEEAAEQGLNRGLIPYSKARYLEYLGRYDEAEALYDTLGMIRRYWLMGAFPNRQGMGFVTEYPPEKEIRLDQQLETLGGLTAWYRMDQPVSGGRVNFENYFVEVDNVVAYAMTYVYSPDGRPAEIRAGSDDTLTVFLNGEQIWINEEYRGVSFDADVIPCELAPGWNTLMFKVCEDWGGWELMARITAPGGEPLTNIVISLDDQL